MEGEIRFEDSVETLQSMYDRKNGGFGEAPKFPNFPYLLFLMNYLLMGQSTVLIVVKRCQTLAKRKQFKNRNLTRRLFYRSTKASDYASSIYVR